MWNSQKKLNKLYKSSLNALPDDVRNRLLEKTISTANIATFTLLTTPNSGEGVSLDGWQLVFDKTCPWIDESVTVDRIQQANFICYQLCELFCWYKHVPHDRHIDEYRRRLNHRTPVHLFSRGDEPPIILKRQLPYEFKIQTIIDFICHGLALCMRDLFELTDVSVKYMRTSDMYVWNIYLEIGSQSKLSLQRVFEDMKITDERDQAWRRTLSRREESEYESAEEPEDSQS
tara:strand:+ start:172 stop:864 length:693 start_codon:yes stop_codon:yes gene_type:complete